MSFFHPPFKASLPQVMPVSSHPVRALGGSGPASRPTGPSYERLAVVTLTQSGKTRQRGEQGLRFDSKTSGKMLQRAASNVSDKAKSSKPKVGQQFGGNISFFWNHFFQRRIVVLWKVCCWLFSTVDALNLVNICPSYLCCK